MPADSHGDASRDTVSLTYQELANRLGIDVQSARRRVLRAGWAKVPGNDGRARVSVPASVLPAVPATTTAPLPPVAPAEPPPAAPVPATPEALSHLLSRVAEMGELRDQLGRLEAERDAARAEAAAERGRAERAEAERDAARAEREAAKVAAASAEGEAKGLRLALEEARRPFWRRWLG